MKRHSVISQIGVGMVLSMAATFSNAALECKDVDRSNYDAPENMETLAKEARLIGGYFNRYHEAVVSELCGYSEDDGFGIEHMIDTGYVRRSEVEGIKEVLGLDNRSTAGRNFEYAYIKLSDETSLSGVGASNAAHLYAYEPHSKCAKLVKRVLAGDQSAVSELERLDLQSESNYCGYSE